MGHKSRKSTKKPNALQNFSLREPDKIPASSCADKVPDQKIDQLIQQLANDHPFRRGFLWGATIVAVVIVGVAGGLFKLFGWSVYSSTHFDLATNMKSDVKVRNEFLPQFENMKAQWLQAVEFTEDFYRKLPLDVEYVWRGLSMGKNIAVTQQSVGPSTNDLVRIQFSPILQDTNGVHHTTYRVVVRDDQNNSYFGNGNLYFQLRSMRSIKVGKYEILFYVDEISIDQIKFSLARRVARTYPTGFRIIGNMGAQAMDSYYIELPVPDVVLTNKPHRVPQSTAQKIPSD